MFAKKCSFDYFGSVGLGSQGKCRALTANSEFLLSKMGNRGLKVACDSTLALM